MRTRLLLLCLFCNVLSIQAQYYIRGEISDDKGNMLQNVKILLHSTGLSYSSGVGGAFGILTNQVMDSLSFQKEGYEPLTLKVRSTGYQTIKMKMMPFTASLHEHHLLSFTEDLDKLTGKTWYVGGKPIIDSLRMLSFLPLNFLLQQLLPIATQLLTAIFVDSSTWVLKYLRMQCV